MIFKLPIKKDNPLIIWLINKKVWLIILFASLIVTLAVGLSYIKFQSSDFIPIVNKPGKVLASGPPQFLYALSKDGITETKSDSGFKGPLAVTVAQNGKIFVADTGNSEIQVFSPEGKWKSSFGKDNLVFPSGLTTYKDKLYITDPNSKKVFVYGEDGKEYKNLIDNKRLSLNNGNLGEVIRPAGIHIGSDDLFYLTDIANQAIVVLDAEGNILKSFGSAGTSDGLFQYPNAIWIDNLGKIYVTDSNNGRIQIFNKKGEFLYKITGNQGKNGPLTLPRGIAVTEQGMIYVVDVFTHMVRVFDEAGFELWSFGGKGTDKGKFSFPNGLYIDNLGRILITDRENNQVKVFGYK